METEKKDQRPNVDTTAPEDAAGSAEAALRAAEGLSAGPELNTHGTRVYDARETTGRKATEDWKKNRPGREER